MHPKLCEARTFEEARGLKAQGISGSPKLVNAEKAKCKLSVVRLARPPNAQPQGVEGGCFFALTRAQMSSSVRKAHSRVSARLR